MPGYEVGCAYGMWWVWGVCLVCVCDVCGLHVFCVWGLVCVLLECVCGMYVCVCVCVSCMCGVCVVHTGHAVECGMAIGYTPRSGHPSLRPQLEGVGTVSISPSKPLPCGRLRCGLPRPSLGFSWAQSLDEGPRKLWPLGRQNFPCWPGSCAWKACIWEGSWLVWELEFQGELSCVPWTDQITCTARVTRMVCAECLLSSGESGVWVPARQRVQRNQPPVKALGLSSGSSSVSSTRGWSWRPPTRPSSLEMYRDEMKVLVVLRGSVSLEYHPLKHSH